MAASGDPLLHITFGASCEVLTGGRGQKYECVGIALHATTGLCVAVGNEKRIATFPAASVQKVFMKFLGSGKLTFEVGAGKQGTKQILVSKAQPDDLRGLLTTLDEASKRAKQRGAASISQDEAFGLLQTRYPQQVAKQLAKLREGKGSDAPQPLKDHHRLMLVVDAAGQSVAQAGKALCRLAESDFKLTSHPRPGECNSQSYKAVCKDPADKSAQLEMRVRVCVHHRFKQALWIDLEIGEKLAAAAVRAAVVRVMAGGEESKASITQLGHGAIKERLAGGLVLHLRSGSLNQGSEFGTRLELRRADLDAQSAPIGRCDLRFWEEGNRMAAPVVTAFEMHTEGCRAWSMANGNRPAALLAITMVQRLEVFSLRLAASATGLGSRTRVLVAGWLPQVKTAAFVKREFLFQGAPDESLGFKMLRSDAAKKPDAAAKRDEAESSTADPTDSPTAGAASSGEASASADAPVKVEGRADGDGADAGGGGGGATPATGSMGAGGKRRKVEMDTPVGGEAAGPSRGVEEDIAAEAASQDGAGPSEPEPVREAPEAIELGELSMLGRVGTSKTSAEDAAEYVPVTSKYTELVEEAPAGGGGMQFASGTAEAEGEEDELDATMAELLG